MRSTHAILAFCTMCAGPVGAAPLARLIAPDTLEPGARLIARLSVTNDGTNPVRWTAAYTLQADGAMYSVPPPDPVYGSDRAVGAKSWTVVQGKVIERGSLTDGKDYTDCGTDWSNDGYAEAFQFVYLGRNLPIRRLAYLSGDANHSWKVDVSVSSDGSAYTPVDGLQDFDTYKRWGEIELPLRGPVAARYIRLRYHKDGEKTPVFRMPCRLSVYAGAADADWSLPAVAPILASGRIALTAPPGGEGSTVIRIGRPLPTGLYLLSARLDNGSARQLVYRHVMVLPAPMARATPASRFGINAANGNWAPVLRRLGVGWVRFENMKWPFFSPAPGVYKFDGSVKPWAVNADAILRGYTDAGISVLPFLFMTAGYASSAPAGVAEGRNAFYPPRNPADFAEFAYQVAARYGMRSHPPGGLRTPDLRSGLKLLHTYEIWNEPNLTDPGWGPWVGTQAQYLEMLRAASEAVKRADPGARVTNAGYAGIQVKTVDMLRSHTFADGKHPLDFVDILNVHFYSGRVPPETATDDFNANINGDTTAEQDFRRLVAWRNRYKPSMPIWLSETGYDSAGPYGTDEATQAARLPRVVMLALANGMDKVFVYRESGSTASMHAASGVLRDDGSYKPSFLTVATLIRQLDGVTGGAVRLPYPDSNVRIYLWQRQGKPILSAWTIEGPARVRLNLGRAVVTNAFGNRRSEELRNGLTLTAYPVYIRDVSDTRAIGALLAEAHRVEAREAARRRILSRANAYLYKFGGSVDGVTLNVGRERPYTPVLPAAVYSDSRGFGFWPGPAGEIEERKWIRADLDKTAVKLLKGQEFRVRVAPGRYMLRCGIGPYEDAHLRISGATGGDRVLAAPRGETVVNDALQAPGGILSFSIDNYATVRWLTLVEIPPGR